MGFSYGGKPAADVATRSPQLPLIAPGTERRAKESARRDKHVEAAAWRGQEVCWLLARIARLTPIRERLDAELDAMDWRDPRWLKRRHRYGIVAGTVGRYRQDVAYLGRKVEALIRAKPATQQTAISGAYFAALNDPPPPHRPARIGWTPDRSRHGREERLVGDAGTRRRCR